MTLNQLHGSDEVQACTWLLQLQHFGNFKIYAVDASKSRASLGWILRKSGRGMSGGIHWYCRRQKSKWMLWSQAILDWPTSQTGPLPGQAQYGLRADFQTSPKEAPTFWSSPWWQYRIFNCSTLLSLEPLPIVGNKELSYFDYFWLFFTWTSNCIFNIQYLITKNHNLKRSRPPWINWACCCQQQAMTKSHGYGINQVIQCTP